MSLFQFAFEVAVALTLVAGIGNIISPKVKTKNLVRKTNYGFDFQQSDMEFNVTLPTEGLQGYSCKSFSQVALTVVRPRHLLPSGLCVYVSPLSS